MAQNLVREYARASKLATGAGFAPRAQDVALRAQELMLRDDLHHDFYELGRTYQRLLTTLVPQSGSRFQRWLNGRAEVHFAQADTLRREA